MLSCILHLVRLRLVKMLRRLLLMLTIYWQPVLLVSKILFMIRLSLDQLLRRLLVLTIV